MNYPPFNRPDLWTPAPTSHGYPLPVIPGAQRTEHVGSRVTCVPAPKGTDDDWLVLVKSLDQAALFFNNLGWRLGGSAPTDVSVINPGRQFWSFTSGEINVILTESDWFFDLFMLATRVAKKLNLQHKVHRIDLFQAILYGVCP